MDLDITIATFTTVGTRPVNEDYLLTWQDGPRCMIALADGLGGHGMGDTASRLACETAIEAMHAEPQFSDDDFHRVYDACQGLSFLPLLPNPR